jgi:hypothetical protein
MAARRRDLRTNRPALIRYAAAWLVAGVAAALLVIAVLDYADDDPAQRRAGDPIGKVTASGCVLEALRGRAADVSRPPVTGPPARPVAEGIYRAPQPRERLVGALRRGVVVIQYERRLSAAEVGRLRAAFTTPAPRRILAPDGTGMAFKVAATAWGRLIGCSRVDAGVIQALRQFAQRYGGRGPDG